MSPRVSAIIPTRNRPELVVRAVRSALCQTYPDVEIVVVVDGPDTTTVRSLNQVREDRVRILELPQSVGGAGARNLGVQAASGEWVAFLDDDDEWLPTKIEQQLSIANECGLEYPIVSCRSIATTAQGTFTLPKFLADPTQHISDYIFGRKTPLSGSGLLLTITILTKRQLMLQVPFRKGLKRHQEWDWVLRAVHVEGAGVVFSPEPLCVWNLRQGGVSRTEDWKYSLEWIASVRNLVTPRAYSSFLLTYMAGVLARSHARRHVLQLLKEAYKNGEPRAIDLLTFAMAFCVPDSSRRKLRKAATFICRSY